MILVLILVTMIKKTKTGMAMRAVSRDFETSELMGIKINNVISMTFAIGSGLAAIGGFLVAAQYDAIYPTMSQSVGNKAFAAAILGGIGNIPEQWWEVF